MLLTGEMIDSIEAKRISLINDHVPGDNLHSAVMSVANKIAGKSLATIKLGKEAFYRQHEMSLSEAYNYTSAIMTENSLADDAKGGHCSILRKT